MSSTSKQRTSQQRTSQQRASQSSSHGPQRSGPAYDAAIWKELRAPFSLGELGYIYKGSESREGRAVVQLLPHSRALKRRLDRVLGPSGYSCRYETIASGEGFTVTCHLEIGGAARSGISTFHRAEAAAQTALVRAGQAFGIGWQAEAVGRIAAEMPLDFEALPEEIVDQLMGKGMEAPPVGPVGAGPEEGSAGANEDED